MNCHSVAMWWPFLVPPATEPAPPLSDVRISTVALRRLEGEIPSELGGNAGEKPS